MPNDLFAEDFVVDPNKNYVEELVGEGKKFASVEDLARGKAESDAFIARLQNEQVQLRNELETRMNLKEFLDQIKTSPLPVHSNDDDTHNQRDLDKDKSVLKPEDLEHLLEQKFRQKEVERTAQQNFQLAKNKLQEVLGPNYALHVKKQAQDLGISEQDLTRIAETNPNVLFRILGIDGKKSDNTFDPPPRTQVTGLPSNSRGKGDSYYERLRQDKPQEYWSAKVQNEIFERIKEIGPEAFYNS